MLTFEHVEDLVLPVLDVGRWAALRLRSNLEEPARLACLLARDLYVTHSLRTHGKRPSPGETGVTSVSTPSP